MTIIAFSDVHLGYDNRIKPIFTAFLNELEKKADIEHIVICGDFIDMWRRDLAGVLVENTDILDTLQRFITNKGIKVHYMVGNHDYYFINLKSKPSMTITYSFNFNTCVRLPSGQKHYRFLHGDQFDWLQNPDFSYPLCYTTDEEGALADKAWKALMRVNRWWRITSALFRKNLKEMLKENWKPAGNRPTHATKVTQKVCKEAREQYENDCIIFGHTHQPGMNDDGTIVNCGSWVASGDPTNQPPYTFVEITNGQVKLLEFKQGSTPVSVTNKIC